MKLTEKTKKWLTLAGLSIVSIVLVIAIASQFKTEVPEDPEVQPTQAVSSEITPSADIPASTEKPTEKPTERPTETLGASVSPIEPTETPTVTEGADTGKSTGTEQTIQAEPTKPAAPTEKPTPKTESPTTNTSERQKSNTEGTVKTTPKEPAAGEKNEKGQMWVPGFGWTDDSGPNTGTKVGNDDDELTGNKVGSMD